jgi:hypothetical protein
MALRAGARANVPTKLLGRLMAKNQIGRAAQGHDGLAYRLWRDIDQTSRPPPQFEDPNRARDREAAVR